jgi:hypothetical protein
LMAEPPVKKAIRPRIGQVKNARTPRTNVHTAPLSVGAT